MDSKASKPIARRVAEHSWWPAESRYPGRTDSLSAAMMTSPVPARGTLVSLGDILTPARIKVPLAGLDKSSVVTELVGLLTAAGDLRDPGRVIEAIASRERVASTGLCDGLAIPHAKTSQVEDVTMALGVAPEPIDFDSIDHQGVRIVVLLLSPRTISARDMSVLRSITGMMHIDSVRNTLLTAQSPEAVYNAIRTHEAAA